jgi:hypothetical protein
MSSYPADVSAEAAVFGGFDRDTDDFCKSPTASLTSNGRSARRVLAANGPAYSFWKRR